MKIKKIIAIIAILFSTLIITNISRAYTMSVNDINAKANEEFTVTINVDEETPLANGQIKFDASKVEFVKVTQENMNARVTEDGNLAWIYVNLEGTGLKQFEFIFKMKKNGHSEMKFEDLAFVDLKGNEYSNDKILGNTTIQINSNKNVTKIVIGVVIVVIIALIAIVFIKKKKEQK